MNLSNDIDRKLGEMEYCSRGESTPSKVLALGIYKGFQYLVINHDGLFPCGYVNISGYEKTIARDDFQNHKWRCLTWVDCHGGVTFADAAIWPFAGGWWIGWDYAHINDYVPYNNDFYSFKHSTGEVVCECKNVIEQICERIKP